MSHPRDTERNVRRHLGAPVELVDGKVVQPAPVVTGPVELSHDECARRCARGQERVAQLAKQIADLTAEKTALEAQLAILAHGCADDADKPGKGRNR